MEENCEIILDHLDDYLDDRLAAAQKAVLDQHLAVCASCCQILEQAKDYFSAVHSMPLVETPAELRQRILHNRYPDDVGTGRSGQKRAERAVTVASKAEKAQVHRLHPAALTRLKWQYFGAGMGVATAAAISLAVVLQLMVSGPQVAHTVQPLAVRDGVSEAVAVASTTKASSVLAIQNQARHIYFLVESPRALEDVTFSVLVPPNMHLQGYAKRQTLVWKGRLQRGENLLSLPLVVTAATPGVVVMRIDHQQAHKEFQVKVDVLSS